MNKRMLCMLLCLGVALGLNVTMEMPEKVALGQDTGVFVEITGTADKFDFAVLLPEGWHVKEWDVESYDKNWVTFEITTINAQGKIFEVAHWKFGKRVVNYAKLYFVFVPKDSGVQTISGFWVTPEEFGKVESTVEVVKPVCGNGICDFGENPTNCPQDCGIGKGLFIFSMAILIAVVFLVWFVLKKVKE